MPFSFSTCPAEIKRRPSYVALAALHSLHAGSNNAGALGSSLPVLLILTIPSRPLYLGLGRMHRLVMPMASATFPCDVPTTERKPALRAASYVETFWFFGSAAQDVPARGQQCSCSRIMLGLGDVRAWRRCLLYVIGNGPKSATRIVYDHH